MRDDECSRAHVATGTSCEVSDLTFDVETRFAKKAALVHVCAYIGRRVPSALLRLRESETEASEQTQPTSARRRAPVLASAHSET